MKKKQPLQEVSARFAEVEGLLVRLPVKSQLLVIKALRSGEVHNLDAQTRTGVLGRAMAQAATFWKLQGKLNKRDSLHVQKWINDLFVAVVNSDAAVAAWNSGEDLGVRKRSPVGRTQASGDLRSRTSDLSTGAAQLRQLRGGSPGSGKQR